MANMCPSPDIIKILEGKNDKFKYLVLCASDEDEEIVKAAAGALCMVMSESTICLNKIFDVSSSAKSYSHPILNAVSQINILQLTCKYGILYSCMLKKLRSHTLKIRKLTHTHFLVLCPLFHSFMGLDVWWFFSTLFCLHLLPAIPNLAEYTFSMSSQVYQLYKPFIYNYYTYFLVPIWRISLSFLWLVNLCCGCMGTQDTSESFSQEMWWQCLLCDYDEEWNTSSLIHYLSFPPTGKRLGGDPSVPRVQRQQRYSVPRHRHCVPAGLPRQDHRWEGHRHPLQGTHSCTHSQTHIWDLEGYSVMKYDWRQGNTSLTRS